MRAFLLFLMMALQAAGAPNAVSPPVAEREKSEDAVLGIWPEAADPQSLMAREINRLLQFYSARKDPRLASGNAPMWIASEAATNIERLRTAGDSEQTAMRLYPDLAVLGSPLNKLFRDTYARFKEVDPRFFDDPRWPIKLGQQCYLQLEAQNAMAGISSGPKNGGTRVMPETASEPEPASSSFWSALGKSFLEAVVVLMGVGIVVVTIRYALRVRREHPRMKDDWTI